MNHQDLIEKYLAGPELVERAVQKMSGEQLDATPIAGKWSTRQVVCHIVDFEPVYADRMKRVIAENCPSFFGGDPDVFAAHLAYEQRAVGTELELMTAVRRQMGTILRGLKVEDFQRMGKHSEAGPLSLETLLQRIADHAPHHVRFIDEKRKALGC
ncbi:MAG TPA: DinB family protein [Lacipirellulaceae bacterium]|nr:DinB family protein [Lacipirellulaceae bacterium]